MPLAADTWNTADILELVLLCILLLLVLAPWRR